MKLVVAEKPSVARDIAAVIGADKSNADGTLHGNGYIVTSARGHLVRLKTPNEYDEKYQKWALDDLPIIPDFEFIEIENAQDVFDRLKKYMLSDEIDSIICATDAGREGECIFRYIYSFIGCKKPFERLWISSLTSESIKQGFSSLLPSSDKDKMYEAGLTRSKIDWLWGMNLSRLYSLYSGVACSIGRVQTAVVNMIVLRDSEIEHFVKKPFYKVKLENGAEWFDEESDSFAEKSAAEAIAAKCRGKICTAKEVKTELKKENRPLLYSLTSLQSDANDKLGFSAKKTLDLIQALYEKKLLTYPRTDSNYITDDMGDILAQRVEQLSFFRNDLVEQLLNSGLNLDSRVVNNSKVSDHHAIIPTENIAAMQTTALSDDEKAMLSMVITRFLAALSSQYEYYETSFTFVCEGETFRLKAKTPFKLGWKAFYQEEKEEENVLHIAQGDTFTADKLIVSECETQPPKHFTESTLLKAMENIDRRIEDKELAEYVSERGLGTPATRAAIIERIIEMQYVERKGKQLLADYKGKKLISILPENVKSIELTAQMEQQLSLIERGEISSDNVISEIINNLNDIIEAEKNRGHISLAPPKVSLGKCPKCNGEVYSYTFNKDGKSKMMFYCENSSSKKEKPCIFRLYEDDLFWTSKGKKLTESMIKSLLTKGKIKATGLKSEKKGTTYNAVVSLTEHTDKKSGNVYIGFSMEFDNSDKSKAAKTRKGDKK